MKSGMNKCSGRSEANRSFQDDTPHAMSSLKPSSTENPRRTLGDDGIPLEDSYQPFIELDATNQQTIAQTFPKAGHRLSDFNFRQILNSGLSLADRV